MTGNSFYSEVLLDHNMNPLHKHDLPGASCRLDGVNPSCGDSMTLQLQIEDGVIENGSFSGVGCAVSQASADIMLDLIIGKSLDEAKRLSELFLRMIAGDASEDEIDELEEAGALRDISHMPARVKCAVLSWRTLDALLREQEDKQ